jgi:hypothetical protein
MERWQIIVLCVIFIVIWVLVKQGLKRRSGGPKEKESSYPDIESWYGNIQDEIAAMDEDQKKQKELNWQKMSVQERLDFSEQFIRSEFGPKVSRIYRVEEKLKLGKARFISTKE